MATVSELVFKAAFGELVQAKGVLGELKDKTEQAQAEADKLNTKLSLASKAGVAFGAAIGTGITTLATMTAAGIAYADSIDEMSQRLAVSTEALSGWAYGAQFAGMSQEDLYGAINKLNNVMDDAFSGSKKASEAFERLGITVEDAGGNIKSSEQMMGELADAFEGLNDNASKSAIASELFGKAAGPAMASYLSQGRKGIEELNAEALRFGLIVTSEVASAAGQFNDRLDQMRGVAKGMGTQIAAGLLPTLNNLGQMLTDTANDTGAMSTAVSFLDTTLKGLVSAGIIVAGVFKTVGQGLGAIAAAVMSAAQGEFKQALNIIKMGVSDAGKNITGVANSVSQVMSGVAASVAKEAPKTGRDLAKPVSVAKEVVKKDVAEIKNELASIVGEIQNIADPTKQWTDKIAQADEALKAKQITVEQHTAALARYNKEIVKILFAETEVEQINREAAESEQRRLQHYLDMGDPMKQYRDQMAEITVLMDKYAEYPEMLDKLQAAQLRVVDDMQSSLKKTKDEQGDLMKELVQAAEGYGKDMSSAFVDWMAGAKTSFSDMIRSMLLDLAKMMMYQAVMKPLMAGVNSFFGFSDGGVFANGAPQPFATGLVNSPTFFPMANGGTGLAGESGTEAIMPLRRDAAGRLGVAASGSGDFNTTININISDVKAQDAPAVSKAAQDGVDRAIRGLVQHEMFNQMRLGNAFNPIPLKGF